MSRRIACAAVLLCCAVSAAADGGRVRLHDDAGPFTITVFTAPEPLTAGSADVSVLVQDENGEVLLDVKVEIGLRAPGQNRARFVEARRGTNRLLHAASLALATPGDWGLDVVVRREGASGAVACVLRVGPAVSPLAPVWPYLAFPPLAVALFAVRNVLVRRVK